MINPHRAIREPELPEKGKRERFRQSDRLILLGASPRLGNTHEFLSEKKSLPLHQKGFCFSIAARSCNNPIALVTEIRLSSSILEKLFDRLNDHLRRFPRFLPTSLCSFSDLTGMHTFPTLRHGPSTVALSDLRICSRFPGGRNADLYPFCHPRPFPFPRERAGRAYRWCSLSSLFSSSFRLYPCLPSFAGKSGRPQAVRRPEVSLFFGSDKKGKDQRSARQENENISVDQIEQPLKDHA